MAMVLKLGGVYILTNMYKLAQAVTFPPCIQEIVRISDRALTISSEVVHSFPQPLQANNNIADLLQIGHDHFLPLNILPFHLL
jgi:hypothetical protein